MVAMQKPRTWEEFRQLAYEKEKALPLCELCGKRIYPQDNATNRTFTVKDKDATREYIARYHNTPELPCYEEARASGFASY